MKQKPKDYTLAAIALVILIAVLASSCTQELPQLRYYNAYSPLYDEYFVMKSNRPLSVKDVVWFDDNAQAVDYATPYVCTILSPYNNKIN